MRINKFALFVVMQASALAGQVTYTAIAIGTLGSTTSVGESINASGQVTGLAEMPGSARHAFLYTPGRGMKDLGTLGGATSIGNSINASGGVTGQSSTLEGDDHAFVYSGDTMYDLNALITSGLGAGRIPVRGLWNQRQRLDHCRRQRLYCLSFEADPVCACA